MRSCNRILIFSRIKARLPLAFGGRAFQLPFLQKEGDGMCDYIERLIACGVNLIDAYEIVEDYLYDEDHDGLDRYVLAVEKGRRE